MTTDSSFAVMASVLCSTERKALTTGYAANLQGLKCIPLSPLDAETRLRLQLNTPNILWQTFLQGNPDIKAGDKLVIGIKKYIVKTIEPWPWFPGTDTRPMLILEDTDNP